MKLLQGTQGTFLFSPSNLQQSTLDPGGGAHWEQPQTKNRMNKNVNSFPRTGGRTVTKLQGRVGNWTAGAHTPKDISENNYILQKNVKFEVSEYWFSDVI